MGPASIADTTRFGRVRAALLWPLRAIVGRDFFVSYTRRDAAPYAAKLAALLGERHSDYLDQLDTPQGADLPPRLVRALRLATTMVVVGSPESTSSRWVAQELALFAVLDCFDEQPKCLARFERRELCPQKRTWLVQPL
jgi:hypothetical protein